jgi:hypothetical protein
VAQRKRIVFSGASRRVKVTSSFCLKTFILPRKYLFKAFDRIIFQMGLTGVILTAFGKFLLTKKKRNMNYSNLTARKKRTKEYFGEDFRFHPDDKINAEIEKIANDIKKAVNEKFMEVFLKRKPN